MARKPVQQTNVLWGAFLISSLLMAVFISFELGGVLGHLGTFKRYTVRFDIDSGAPGLKPNSPVTFGGYPVGRVVDIGPQRVEPGERFPNGWSIAATINVRADIDLHPDAAIELEQPLLGALSSLNISSIGGAGEPVPDGGEIIARPVGSLLEQVGIESGIVTQAQTAIANLDASISETREVIRRIGDMTAAFEPLVVNEDGEVRVAIRALERTLVRIDERSAAWADRLDEILADASGISASLRPAAVDAGEVVGTVRGLVDANAGRIDRTIANLDAIAAWGATEGTARLGRVLDAAADVAETTRAVLAKNEPSIDRTLANFRIASETAVLTIAEIRAQPWRALQRPETKELEQQLLYDSARSYAMAAADLRAAAASLRSILADTPTDAAPVSAEAAERVRQLTASLDRAFEGYAEAERALLDRLIDAP